MEGTVTWPQAIWILTVIGAASVAGFLIAWRIQLLRSRDRHDVRAGYEQQIALLQDTIESTRSGLENRINAIELSNAGTFVILKHMEDFQKEVKLQYEQLRKERREDMERIHRRLDAVHNAARLFTTENET